LPRISRTDSTVPAGTLTKFGDYTSRLLGAFGSADDGWKEK